MGSIDKRVCAAYACIHLLLLSPAVSAADVALKPVDDWTGLYTGLSGGVALSNSEFSYDLNRFTPTGPSTRQLRTTIDDGSSDIIGGALLGYNWRSRGVVMGLETDLSYLGFEKTARRDFMLDTGNNLLPASTTLGFNLDSLGTVRGRVGYASDRLLLFGTGGLAYGSLETNGRITLDGARISNDSASGLRFGWALGAGLEYALDKNWLIGADYLFADLGNGKADTKSAIPTAFEFGETGNMELRFSLTRITLKYRF